MINDCGDTAHPLDLHLKPVEKHVQRLAETTMPTPTPEQDVYISNPPATVTFDTAVTDEGDTVDVIVVDGTRYECEVKDRLKDTTMFSLDREVSITC